MRGWVHRIDLIVLVRFEIIDRHEVQEKLPFS